MKKKIFKKFKFTKKVAKKTIVVGLVLIVLSFALFILEDIRKILFILGSVIVVIGLYKVSLKKTKKKLKYLIPLAIVGFIMFDFLLALIFKINPLFSYSIKYENDMNLYNAIGYRLWECDSKDKKIDILYQAEFYCDVKYLSELDIEYLLTEIDEEYNNYKDKYIVVTGKISAITSIDFMEMKRYDTIDDVINGYVEFKDGLKLSCEFNDETLSKYNVYDNVEVVGRLTSVEETNEEKIVHMKDCGMIETNEYEEYTIDIEFNKSCSDEKELYYEDEENKTYTVCLDSAYVKFNNESIYELNYALQDRKVIIDDLTDNYNSKEEFAQELGVKYNFDNYSVTVCSSTKSSSDVIITDSKIKTNEYCEEKNPDNKLEE